MSIAQLPASGRSTHGDAQARTARERLAGLVAQIDADRLNAAESLLAGVVAHQQTDLRGLTEAETAALARLGATEDQLQQPTALPASTRGLVWEQQLGAQSVSVAEAAEILGVTPTRVRQRCAAGTLLAQRRSDGWHLPAFQFHDRREPRGWATVAQAIPRATPLLLAERVLTSPAPRLRIDGEELAPLEWLAQGGDPHEAAAAVDDALSRLP
ncbi:hypothetical protein [Leucobacter sp. gxy201]|uniref:hypothetical protein n=1 Tax=Leucobacter sp. gxy201 TaxID=2957200 RepID=UPI003DA19BE5